MKKLNNKGLTITELLVSVALISVVMLFMYRMLADITFQKDNEYFASQNQEQRIEMIHKIEKTIDDNIDSIIGYSPVNEDTLSKLTLIGSTPSSTIEIQAIKASGILKIIKAESTLYEWQLKGGKFSDIKEERLKCSSVENAAFNKRLVECKIKVYTENTKNTDYYDSDANKIIDNNNTIDDIEFSFMIDI
ncbi:MAG: prepilin-type N-terminal cleavage/methylation domain-containing protein [Bacilli bacterium]|nr:prepilin-type N-terminal cleavage/methylation domain-containing protein [Bacilli bacterium]